MSTATPPPSMNSANERDPYNNSSYGTLVDAPYKLVRLPVLDVNDFNERIIRSYEEGTAETGLPADLSVARSLVPAGTATLRDFSYIAPDLPEYLPNNCTGCMDCVTLCPDTAILGKVVSESDFEKKVAEISDPAEREMFRQQWSKTRKYYEGPVHPHEPRSHRMAIPAGADRTAREHRQPAVAVGATGGSLYVKRIRRSRRTLRGALRTCCETSSAGLAKGAAPGATVDYERVAKLAAERRGFPIPIMTGSPDLQAEVGRARRVTNVGSYEWFAEDGAEKASPPGR